MYPFHVPPPERARQLRPAELEAAHALTGLAHWNWVRAEPLRHTPAPAAPWPHPHAHPHVQAHHHGPIHMASLAAGRMRAQSQSLPEPRTPNPARFSAPPVLQGVGHYTPTNSSPSLDRDPRPRRLVESPAGVPCPNCKVAESTLWRACALLSGTHYLCNACGLRFKKGKYCPLCTRVYYDADTHTGQYRQCGTCGNWTHRHCLREAGVLEGLEANGGDPFTRQPPYTCAHCLPQPKPLPREGEDPMDITR